MQKTKQQLPSRKTRLPRKTMLLIIAFMVCVGMVSPGMLVQQAEAAESRPAAALVIVHGLDFSGNPQIVLNKSYAFDAGDTVADLFQAAKDSGDIKDFTVGAWNGLASIKLEGATAAAGDDIVIAESNDMSLYWSDYINGAYGTGSIMLQELVNESSYQFAWTSYPTAVAPDWDVVSNAPPAEGAARAGNAQAPVEGSSTLSIVHGLDFAGVPQVILNSSYEYSSGATVADLFQAAKDSGDIKDFTVGAWNGLASIKLEGPTDAAGDDIVIAESSDMSLYWSDYINGAYGTGSIMLQTLSDGFSYQFAWASYPTALAPDWSTIPPSFDNEADVTTPSLPDTSNASTALDQAKYETLFQSVLARYQSMSDRDLQANSALLSEWIVMSVAATGDTSSFSKEAVATLALDASKNPMAPGNSLNVQKAIIAANAYGLDATSIPTAEGNIDLINLLFTDAVSSMNDLYGKIFTVLALKGGNYQVPATSSITLESLVQGIIASQESEGGFAPFGGTKDTDSTAMAICALAAAQDQAGASSSLARATQALLSYRQADGGFADTVGTWNPTPQTNANSTAMAVVALCAAGINPAADWGELESLSVSPQSVSPPSAELASLADSPASTQTAELAPLANSGVSPLSALLALSNSSQTGFVSPGDADMATEQGFRALVAYQGFVNTGRAYNIYVQAREGVAGLAGTTGNASNNSAGSAGGVALPQTGDNSGALMGVTVILTLSAFGVLLYARRKRQQDIRRPVK